MIKEENKKYQDVSRNYVNNFGAKLDSLIISYIKKPNKVKNERLERLQIHYNFIVL